jgi:hypothetical protein
MADSELLTMLKVDLGISTTAYDERLAQYIKTAKTEITREGVTLTDSVGDASLVVMYSAWMWRRRDTGEGMPRMVRYALNNRVLSEKMNNG